ncbi:MAG TPA: hypothetical protein PLO44_01630 [Candidatus Paceibacterota bacterium]|nr:hypothetical protein [Candidatus Paceibacterota bacterium]
MENKDLLQIKIDEAKEKLSEETKNAINAVNWRAAILSMRERRGYSFSQLEDLEIETELLLYGLITPEEYQKKIEDSMKITKEDSTELVNQMNDLVFQKIREELVKASESKKIKVTSESEIKKVEKPEEIKLKIETPEEKTKEEQEVLIKSGINIVPEEKKEEAPVETQTEKREEMLAGVEKPETITQPAIPKMSFMAQKLGGTFQISSTETKHEKADTKVDVAKHTIVGPGKTDPYREPIE